MALQPRAQVTGDAGSAPFVPGVRGDLPRRGLVRWLVLAGAVIVIAIVIGTAVPVNNFRQRALDNSKRELENTVLLLQNHTTSSFRNCSASRKACARN